MPYLIVIILIYGLFTSPIWGALVAALFGGM